MLIHKNVIKALHAVNSTKEGKDRAYGIEVKDGAVTATDGHLLLTCANPAACQADDYPTHPPDIAEIPDPGESFTGVLPSATVADVAKNAKAPRHGAPICDHVVVIPASGTSPDGQSDPQARVVATNLKTSHDRPHVALISTPFPPHAIVCDKTREQTDGRPTLTLGVPVLEALLKAAKAIDAKGITLTSPDARDGQILDACAVRIETTHLRLDGCVMPMRR